LVRESGEQVLEAMGQTRAVESIQSILLVEGNDPIRQSLAEQIEFYMGIDTVEAATGVHALKLVKKQKFALILLDMSLPDFDGRDVYQLMRCSGLDTPIVIFIETGTEVDTFSGLSLGAAQYIVKPFRLGLLLARIRSLVCDQDLQKTPIMTIGQYCFEPDNKLLIDAVTDKEIRLTEKETSILELLYLSDDKVVRRDILLDTVWGYKASVKTHTLETHIYRLRQKIEIVPSESKILITEAGGYRLRR